MVKKHKPGRPKGSKNRNNRLIKLLRESSIWETKDLKIGDTVKVRLANDYQTNLEYIKDYPSTASFRSRLEAATVKFEQAINETIEQLKGKV